MNKTQKTERHSGSVLASNRSGFTLVELLITVSILLVLAGITVTTLNYSAEKEKSPMVPATFKHI